LLSVDLDPVRQEWLNRRNGRVYFWSYCLIFLAGPIMYLGVFQTTLCDWLGAGPTVANLPAAAYSLGLIAPLFVSWLVPHRHDRTTVVWCNGLMAVSLIAVAVFLVMPISPQWKIAMVVGQGFGQGLLNSVSDMFTLQCLARGTTVAGRADALRHTYTFSPILAIVGSLGVQYIFHPGFPWLRKPFDFACVYLLAGVCIAGLTVISLLYRMPPLEDKPRTSLLGFFREGVRDFIQTRQLLLAFVVALLWTGGRLVSGNMALFARTNLGAMPSDYSGTMLAIQFGGKAIGGFVLGWLAVRFGMRSPVIGVLAALAAGAAWAWAVPGPLYLLCFAFIGATLLGGVYLPNYVLLHSDPRDGVRNISILSLSSSAAFIAPAIHGALAERFGFHSSFALTIGCATLGLLLAMRMEKSKGSHA
jgi:MFS family permease